MFKRANEAAIGISLEIVNSDSQYTYEAAAGQGPGPPQSKYH